MIIDDNVVLPFLGNKGVLLKWTYINAMGMNRQSCRKTLRNKEPKKTLEDWRPGSFGKRFTDLFLKVVQSIQESVL